MEILQIQANVFYREKVRLRHHLKCVLGSAPLSRKERGK
jgi:hypothetical protein